MYRQTYAEINLENIKNNTQKLIRHLKAYEYHIGVVKADCYGHDSINVVRKIMEGGVNYLAVATLEEALEIRKYEKKIPILCLGNIAASALPVCQKKQITITINSEDYFNSLDLKLLAKCKVHLKVNTGMNRLGINDNNVLNDIFRKLKNNNVFIEGIYTHIYHDESQIDTENQIEKFKQITKDIDLKSIPIVHFGASGYTLKFPKLDFVNGCRLGIALYGLVETNLPLTSTFSLHSNVIQINAVCNETVGYNGVYKTEGSELIAVVPIGYADGIIRKNTGRTVFINNKKYPIVGNICMDMLFVKIDESVKIGDKVTLIKDNEHIKEIAKYLDTISYEVICGIGKRIPRIYI